MREDSRFSRSATKRVARPLPSAHASLWWILCTAQRPAARRPAHHAGLSQVCWPVLCCGTTFSHCFPPLPLPCPLSFCPPHPTPHDQNFFVVVVGITSFLFSLKNTSFSASDSSVQQALGVCLPGLVLWKSVFG